MIDHPTLGLADIRVSLSRLVFKPTVHLNYQEKVLPIKDGLPKAEGLPCRHRRFRRNIENRPAIGVEKNQGNAFKE